MEVKTNALRGTFAICLGAREAKPTEQVGMYFIHVKIKSARIILPKNNKVHDYVSIIRPELKCKFIAGVSLRILHLCNRLK